MMRFGLAGFGAIGRLRARALRQTPGAELRRVCDASAERLAEAAALGAATTGSFDALCAARDVDAVIVSTPPDSHADLVTRALAAGKHVLCEKPLAPNVAACRRMVEAAEVAGRTLATGFNYRFYPAVARARELIQEGAIGAVDHVRAFAGHPGGPEFTHAWVHDPSIMGGGALMDNGIHVADLALHFLGAATTAVGFTSERVWGFRGSEDNGFVLMRTADGRIGTLHASWTEWRGYRFCVDIYGVEGCVRVWYPPMLTILWKRPAGRVKRGRRRVFIFPGFQVMERLRSYRWTIVRSFVAEHLDFMRRAAGGAGCGASGTDGLRAVELAQSAYRPSATTTEPAAIAVHGAAACGC